MGKLSHKGRLKPKPLREYEPKAQRIGRNPKTGEEVPILPRRVLVFRASHMLKDRINRLLSGSGD